MRLTILNGERVSLTRVRRQDMDFVCALECNHEVWLYEEEVKSDPAAVAEEYRENMDSDSHYDFVVSANMEGGIVPVGLVQAWSYVEHRSSWELGFAILPAYQHRGYGAEAVRLLLDFAFGQLQAHKVVGMCNCCNKQSAALMEKLGFRREAAFKEELLWNGQWHDQYFYAMLAREYQLK